MGYSSSFPDFSQNSHLHQINTLSCSADSIKTSTPPPRSFAIDNHPRSLKIPARCSGKGARSIDQAYLSFQHRDYQAQPQSLVLIRFSERLGISSTEHPRQEQTASELLKDRSSRRGDDDDNFGVSRQAGQSSGWYRLNTPEQIISLCCSAKYHDTLATSRRSAILQPAID